MRLTAKDFEQHLNETGRSLSEDEFIIAGRQYPVGGNYGTLLRRHDPIAFRCALREWREQSDNNKH